MGFKIEVVNGEENKIKSYLAFRQQWSDIGEYRGLSFAFHLIQSL